MKAVQQQQKIKLIVRSEVTCFPCHLPCGLVMAISFFLFFGGVGGGVMLFDVIVIKHSFLAEK